MSIQDLVSKSLETIRQEMFDQLAAKQEEYVAAGWLPIRINLNKGIVRGLIELWCWVLWQLYQFLALVLAQAFPDTATGAWLDLHCKQVGVTRKPSTKATGTVYFTRAGIAGNVPIPAGRVVRTKPDGSGHIYRYVTMAAAILPDGASEVAVAVEAEEYGAAANATAGQICEIVTVIPGIDAVENRAGWLLSEGASKEEDTPLRVRYELAWKQLSGCTKYAYEAWAREVTGVADAKILDQHPRGQGTVDVIVLGTAGIPTQTLLDAVTANIMGTGNKDEKYPINDDVAITAPAAINVSIVAELELLAGDAPTILAAAENRVRALFAPLPIVSAIDPLGVGGDLTRDRLIAALMISNVKRVNTNFITVPVPQDGLAVLVDIQLTQVWAFEA
ncbi:MAG: baseplate J/gp47 family protein [Desulfuromonadaceae bacterium]